MKLVTTTLALAALSFNALASSELPSVVYLDGVAYPLVELDSKKTTNNSVELNITQKEQQQIKQKGFAEMAAAYNFSCRITISNNHYFTNLQPQTATIAHSFEQKCANKAATASLTNLSNASLDLYLFDYTGTTILAGPMRSITAYPANGNYHWIVFNKSTGSRGDGYVKTSNRI
ncbi:hypothetical protein B6A42_09370 [Vibrio coralliilyticus]|uniref:Uncharacterized protein n=1 Tax=Vibrio coralliilyticus TaxID=190893 RepID=A0AAN0SAU6_9VIBR|nr:MULTISPECIES: hypothetical protein [Vibrio]AIW18909.1 hypothetical protein IX92_07545 [Vibrio coralliilyticus]ARC92273.1 hypothetical protein B6A42_09370 [Vibrio coralliilyticus]KFI12249.1 hypothetical protein IX95_09925 [Vibrio sp. B183]NOH37948.1 hypothetical protein [Vibrio coralliilyticus]NOI19320.1 hypothetical protein [Vibrio coralliilyticus]